MSLEQSMKAAIETLNQLDALKAEVVELTALRDSLRDVTQKLEVAEADWLKSIEKTATVRQQASDEAAKIKAQALDAASKQSESIVSLAQAKAKEILTAAADQVAAAKVELSDLKAKLADAYAEHGALSDSLTSVISREESLRAEIDRVKKAVASI